MPEFNTPRPNGVPRHARGRLLVDFIEKYPEKVDLFQDIMESQRTGALLISDMAKMPNFDDIWKIVLNTDYEKLPAGIQALLQQNSLPADFVRFLILGGDDDHPMYEHGVLMQGYMIYGELDLESTTIDADVSLINCLFMNDINLMGAMIDGLISLQTSKIKSLSADRLRTKGSVFLRGRFKAEGAVRLLGAEIGGNLTCTGSSFINQGGDAISANRIKVLGSIFLRDIREIKGEIDLTNAECKILIDDNTAWRGGLYRLNYFTYQQFYKQNDKTNRVNRVSWLNNQINNENYSFSYRQAMRVMARAGDYAEYNKIGYALEERRGDNFRAQLRLPENNNFKSKFDLRVLIFISFCYRLFAGYGYKPLRLLNWLVVFWLGGALIYYGASWFNIFAPIPVLEFGLDKGLELGSVGAPRVMSCIGQNWVNCTDLPKEYVSFRALIYSLDTLIPVIDLLQEKSWGIITDDSQLWSSGLEWGRNFIWLVRWVQQIMGWVLGIMGISLFNMHFTRDREDK